MKFYRWYSSVMVLALGAGCEQAQQDAQKAAAKAAAAATAEVEKAGEAAKAQVERAGEQAKAAAESAAQGLASLKVGDVDLGKDLMSLLEKLKGTLGEVKDIESAKASLPKLEEANLSLDRLVGLVDQLPEAAKPVLANLLKTHSATIIDMVKKVVGIDRVGEILKPVLDQIIAKLSKVSGAEAKTS